MIDFKALYDEKEEYMDRRESRSYNAPRIALEVKYFKVPNLLAVLPADRTFHSVAEIGCATGEIIGTLSLTGVIRRVGFDLSPLNIKAAQQRFPEVEFKAEDFRSSGEKFDLVILSYISEHVPDDVGFLRDAASIAEIVLVNLPLEKCWSNTFRKYGPEDSSGHLRNYSLFDGLHLIEAAGLSVIQDTQKWAMESEYEPMRQALNERVLGARFSGTSAQQTMKALIYQICANWLWLRHKSFASNLFLSAKARV